MVPVASKPPGKQKPPTPPKPVHYQPVNYKRLFDTRSILEIADHRNYDSLLSGNLSDNVTDETTPLIEDEADRLLSSPISAHRSAIKPPLLPKPAHIPSVKCLTSLLMNDIEYESKCSTINRTTPPVAPVAAVLKSAVEDDKLAGQNPFECFASAINQSRCERYTKISTVSQTNNFKTRTQHSLEIGSTNGIFARSITTTSSSNNNNSFDEIHRSFNSDTEFLLERNRTSGRLIRKCRGSDKEDAKNANEDFDSSDKSNRNSWRNNSSDDVGIGHEINEHEQEHWMKVSPRSSSSGSPVIKSKKTDDTNADDGDEDASEQNYADDDDSIGNSSTENSHSMRRRIKTWFGSFGKGNQRVGGGGSGKRRDSVFYVEPSADANDKNAPMWETASVSSVEDKRENTLETTTQTVGNGNAEQELSFEQSTRNESTTIDEAARKEKKAFYVVQELISSEKVFIDVLNLLTKDFVEFVNKADLDSSVIADADLNKIINYLPQLKCFNEELCKDFEGRLAQWSETPKISDIIIKKGPFLKLFSTYIQHFEKQCTFLDECCQKNHRFAKTLKDFEASERCKKLTLKHYMLKPVQRLPQYRLLLEDYLSQQNSDSLDYEDTKQALKIVCDVADHADRSVEQGVHFSKLLRIQAQLGNYEIIKPGREFVKAGELYKLSRKEMQLRNFILLNDCLLYTSYYGSMFSLTVKYKLPLAGMKVCIPQVEDYHNEFSIISTTRSFTLRARSSTEREEWVSILDKTIKEHNLKQLSFSPKFVPISVSSEPLEIGKEAPVWIPDDRVTMCQVCTAEFKMTFRRHHCRACGKVVCKNCSHNEAPLQYINFEAARVCDDCYQYLLKEYAENAYDMIKNIKTKLKLMDADGNVAYHNIKATFKKHDPHRSKKLVKSIPPRLKEVTANDTGSQISGWLHRKKGKSWKRFWFVLKEQVLYVYKASEDVIASETIPVLGYSIETFKEASSSYEDIDSKLVFQLAHAGQPPYVFYSDLEIITEKWVAALQEAASI